MGSTSSQSTHCSRWQHYRYILCPLFDSSSVHGWTGSCSVPSLWRLSHGSYFCSEDGGASIEEGSSRSYNWGNMRAAFPEAMQLKELLTPPSWRIHVTLQRKGRLVHEHICSLPLSSHDILASRWEGLRPEEGRQVEESVVWHCQTFLHSAAEECLASPHSILGLEKNVLWFIGIYLNQSQSSWAALNTG